MDADIHGPLVDALRARQWDVVRAIDLYPEGTLDDVHFARAAQDNRVLVTNDRRIEAEPFRHPVIHLKPREAGSDGA
jgi:hypothetical protein